MAPPRSTDSPDLRGPLALRPDRRAALAWFAAAALAGPAPARAAGQPPATGLDPGRLRRAAARAASLEQLHGLVVARGGEIALAEAFRGPPLDRPVNVKSVSKTIVALLAGAAIDRGLVGGVEARLAEVAPELIPPEADPRVGALTLAHLLTMQAGLERTSGPNYGRWVESRNWVATALSQPFVAAPGERMLYSTGSYHVLGAALARRSGRSLLAMARAWLGEPLGIAIPPWTRDPQGYYLGGNNMALSPLDLLRIGEMARQGGLWRGRPVLSQDWLRASWIPRTRSPWSGDTYGYGWFLSQARGHPLAYARGYGGQMLYVVPALGLTIVVTSDPTRPARSEGHVGALHALLAEEIVPAAEEA